MATSYNTVRDSFLSKITDFDLNSLTETQINELFDKYLLTSITKFRYCKQDLNDRNDALRTFNITLTLDEQEILAFLSAIEWLNTKVLHQQFLKDSLGNRDFTTHSPANMLKEKISLRKELANEATQLITFYHYLNWEV